MIANNVKPAELQAAFWQTFYDYWCGRRDVPKGLKAHDPSKGRPGKRYAFGIGNGASIALELGKQGVTVTMSVPEGDPRLPAVVDAKGSMESDIGRQVKAASEGGEMSFKTRIDADVRDDRSWPILFDEMVAAMLVFNDVYGVRRK